MATATAIHARRVLARSRRKGWVDVGPGDEYRRESFVRSWPPGRSCGWCSCSCLLVFFSSCLSCLSRRCPLFLSCGETEGEIVWDLDLMHACRTVPSLRPRQPTYGIPISEVRGWPDGRQSSAVQDGTVLLTRTRHAVPICQIHARPRSLLLTSRPASGCDTRIACPCVGRPESCSAAIATVTATATATALSRAAAPGVRPGPSRAVVLCDPTSTTRGERPL